MTDQDLPVHIVVLDTIKNAPLKVIFAAHFMLTTWGIQGYWSPDSYFFYNLLFFLTLFWGIHKKESSDAVLICFVIDLAAILFDLIILSVYFPRHNYSSSEQFSVAMGILNFVLRPVSCAVLYRQLQGRDNSSSSPGHAFGVPPTARQPRNYQDIENQQQFPGLDSLPPAYH